MKTRARKIKSSRAMVPARRSKSRVNSSQVFYSNRIPFPSKPSISAREAKGLADWGIILRPGIERDTLLTPVWIAESVLAEASRFLKVDLPDEWATHLDQRAERCYARHRQFRKFIRLQGTGGRDSLYHYMRHWLAGKLQKKRLSLFRQLPRSYSLGAPLQG